MRITVTVEDPEPGFLDQLKSLLADHAAAVEIDTEWTVERAERYFLSLPINARRIVEEAAVRDGYVPADELRGEGDGSLRGQSGALKRGVERGARAGWWPEGMRLPIEPQGPGFGKVVGYRMPDELVGIFFTAIKQIKED